MFIFLKSKKTGHCIQSVNKDTTIVLEVRGALLVASLYPWGAAGVPPRLGQPLVGPLSPRVSLEGMGYGDRGIAAPKT